MDIVQLSDNLGIFYLQKGRRVRHTGWLTSFEAMRVVANLVGDGDWRRRRGTGMAGWLANNWLGWRVG